MKIALASAPVLTSDVEHNIASIQRTLAQCGGKAGLVVFGESFLQSFACLTWDYETDFNMAVSQTGPQIKQIREAEPHCGIPWLYRKGWGFAVQQSDRD